MPSTPSFILELPLQVTAKQRAILLKRFDVARQIYNACLGEGLRRLDWMRESKAWRRAVRMPEKTSEQKKARTEAFESAGQAAGFRKHALQSWATTQFTHSWLGEHVKSQEVRALTARARRAIERYQFGIDKPCRNGGQCKYDKKGLPRDCFHCGRPRFKRKGAMLSVENVTNSQGLRWRDPVEAVKNDQEKGYYIQWRDLWLPAIIDEDDGTQQHGLKCRVKYPRIVKRVFNGRDRFFVQLVLEGKPLQRWPTVEGTVGLDIGPSKIAIVGEDEALFVRFCDELSDISAEIRRLQRKIDRQRRANNPQNYSENGTVKKGAKRWHKSRRQMRTEAKLADLQRRQAAYRKSLHGQLANHVLSMGNIIKTEKISYRAFQKNWGRTVGNRAPGMFVGLLRCKAKQMGGYVDEFSTWSTRLSQICHNCATVHTEKSGWDGLKIRVHKCDCGIVAQRDLYSAFLARCVEDDKLIADLARERWDQGAGSLLERAVKNFKQGARRPACSES